MLGRWQPWLLQRAALPTALARRLNLPESSLHPQQEMIIFFPSLLDLLFSPWAAVQISWEMGRTVELDPKLARGPLHMQLFDVCSPVLISIEQRTFCKFEIHFMKS